MKPINQKDQTIQIVTFVGIILSILLLTGFVFNGGVGVAKKETSLAEEKVLVLQDSLDKMNAINKRIFELLTVTDEIDSLLDLYQNRSKAYGELYKKGEGFDLENRARDEVREIGFKIEARKGDMRGLGYTGPKLDGTIFRKLQNNYDELYLNAQIRHAGIATGGTNKEQDQLEKIEELNKQLEAQAKQNLALQKDNTITAQQGDITKLSADVSSLRGKLTQASGLLAVQGPIMASKSLEIKQQTQEIKNYIQQFIKGTRDRDDKRVLQEMLDKFFPIAATIEESSKQMNQTKAQISN